MTRRRTKSKEPLPAPKTPRHYHGKEGDFPSLRDWEIMLFSNSWIRKPLMDDFRARISATLARLREKQGAA